MEFRKLKPNEIDCRVGNVSKSGNGYSLLLYKDARVDMSILDETFGWDGWQREHEFKDGKLYCKVKIWSDRLNQWIVKEDVGTESYTEKEKGQASDSFKRACVNIGIGRELYTAPFIWIQGGDPKKDKWEVQEITYNEVGEIKSLKLIETKSKKTWSFGTSQTAKRETKPLTTDMTTLRNTYGKALRRMSELYGRTTEECEEMLFSKLNIDELENEQQYTQATEIIKRWNSMKIMDK